MLFSRVQLTFAISLLLFILFSTKKYRKIPGSNPPTFLISVSGEWQAASTVSVMPNRWSMCVSVDRQFIGCGESDAAPGE